MKQLRTALLCVGVWGICSVAFAQVTSANFREELDLPEFNSRGPRVLENNGVALPFSVPAGPQLTNAHQISNPSNWFDYFAVTFDPTTNILSLRGVESDAFQTINVTLTGLTFGTAGQQVIGFVPISTGNAAVPYTNTPTLFPTISSSFTGDSVTVNYSVPLGNLDIFELTTAADTYRVVLSGNLAAPEPISLALFALPLAGVALRRAKVRK